MLYLSCTCCRYRRLAACCSSNHRIYRKRERSWYDRYVFMRSQTSSIRMNLQLIGSGNAVATAMGITKVAALAYLMFNLYTPPCFAALGAMNSEMQSGKWLFAGICLQLGNRFHRRIFSIPDWYIDHDGKPWCRICRRFDRSTCICCRNRYIDHESKSSYRYRVPVRLIM